jgi:hypothetical protein
LAVPRSIPKSTEKPRSSHSNGFNIVMT